MRAGSDCSIVKRDERAKDVLVLGEWRAAQAAVSAKRWAALDRTSLDDRIEGSFRAVSAAARPGAIGANPGSVRAREAESGAEVLPEVFGVQEGKPG